MVFTRLGGCLALTMALAIGLGASSSADAAEPATVSFAYANVSLVQSWAYVAQAMGFWKDVGLDVRMSQIAGSALTQALVAGDIDFAGNSGNAVLSAVAANQPIIGIANLYRQATTELVISKDAVQRSGLDLGASTVAQRARALKGLTIAVDSPNSIFDAFLTSILHVGGLKHEDVVVVPTPSPAVNAALNSKRIDGFVNSTPWSTVAEQSGLGVSWINAPRGDLPQLTPFVYTLVTANPAYCEKNADICRKFVAGVGRALAFLKSDPEKSLEVISPTFKGTDPNLLAAGFKLVTSILPPDTLFSDRGWEVTQDFVLDTGLMPASQKLTKFDGVAYTNAYVK